MQKIFYFNAKKTTSLPVIHLWSARLNTRMINLTYITDTSDYWEDIHCITHISFSSNVDGKSCKIWWKMKFLSYCYFLPTQILLKSQLSLEIKFYLLFLLSSCINFRYSLRKLRVVWPNFIFRWNDHATNNWVSYNWQ